MANPGFHEIESKPISIPGQEDRSLLRQTRTQVSSVVGKFARASGVIQVETADWANPGIGLLDWSVTKSSDYFPINGYIPMVLAYTLNAGAVNDAISLIPLPYQQTNTDGAVVLEFAAQVDKRDADSKSADVKVTIYGKSTRAEPSTFTFGFYLLEGAVDGLLNT